MVEGTNQPARVLMSPAVAIKPGVAIGAKAGAADCVHDIGQTASGTVIGKGGGETRRRLAGSHSIVRIVAVGCDIPGRICFVLGLTGRGGMKRFCERAGAAV